MRDDFTALARFPADRAWSHFRLLASCQCDRAVLSASVCKSDGECQLISIHGSHESRGMKDSAIDGMCIDVVFAGDVEASVGIGTYPGVRVTERATDVNMGR